MIRRHHGFGALLLGLTLLSATPAGAQTAGDERPARIGVLAYRGVEAAMSRWQSLADYLSASVDGWRFELVPLTLASTPQQIESKKIDFLLTNPGHFVTLAERFGLSALSTRERATEEADTASGAAGLLQYGTAIVVRNDSTLRGLDDLKGRTVAAVSPDAFGGFQMAWKEFDSQGIDAFEDLGSIRFMGFPQDAIVFAVLDGEVDAGIVRSGLIELLASEGRLDIAAIRVLNANMQLDYPHRISSRLYPEWPLAALPGIDKSLREKVLVALLKTQDRRIARSHGLHDIWSAPLSYDAVRSLVDAYRNRVERRTDGSATVPATLMAMLAIMTVLTLLSAWTLLRRRTALEREAFGPREARPDPDPALDQAQQLFQRLTRRERQILALICSGHQTKSIAETLNISPKTVEFHRTNLLQKTEAGTTPHLVQLATRLGFDQGVSLG